MSEYLEQRDSIRYWLGDDSRAILTTLANRYMGANPAIPPAFRAFSEAGILQTEDGLYDIDLGYKLPHAKPGHRTFR